MQRILTTGKKQLTERPQVSVQSNYFNMSHDVKLTCNMGQIIPCMYMEAVPGDRFDMTTEIMLRLQPMIAPMMQRCTVRTETFFVPNRIIWNNWENFMSAPQGQPVPAVPAIQWESGLVLSPGSFWNYLGVPYHQPPGETGFPEIPLPALPNTLVGGAYSRIIYDWYTNKELLSATGEPQEWIPLQDGTTGENWHHFILANRNWDIDYLTSAMPSPQKGADIRIPGEVILDPNNPAFNGQTFFRSSSVINAGDNLHAAATGDTVATQISGHDVLFDPNGSLVTSGTIEQLRTAEAVLEYMEAENRGGSTYQENVKEHFGVNIPDDRINRAEYLGSTSQPLVIGEVLNTTGTDQLPQGNMAGHGISVARHPGHSTYYATEHGFFMTMLSIIPDSTYADGVDKQFLRTSRLDYLSPEFANLGEQPVMTEEVYYNYHDRTKNGKVWGYVPRYNDYRQKMSRVCGEFISSLRFWTQVRDTSFGFSGGSPVALPLSTEFITIDPAELLEPFAVVDETTAHCLVHLYHQINLQRKLTVFVKPRI